MNPWTIWRLTHIRHRHPVHTCRCGIDYWHDASGAWDHRFQYGHEAVDQHERERRVAAQREREQKAADRG